MESGQKVRGLTLLTFLVSALIHLILFWIGLRLPIPPPATSSNERIEFEVKDAVTLMKDQQKVRESFIPEDMLTRESQDPLSFFSAQNRRVKKQLRALESGLTANRETRRSPMQEKATKVKPAKKSPDLFKLANKDGQVSVTKKSQSSSGIPWQLPPGVSSVGELLPDEIEIGSFTALNTDRYLYYTFFARVEELIRRKWENGVHATIDRTSQKFFQNSLNQQWVTQLDILLRPNGEFYKAILLKPSGIDGLDWSAMDAFASARLFPHPPQEMVEPDGFIHLRYVFNVRINPKMLVRQ